MTETTGATERVGNDEFLPGGGKPQGDFPRAGWA